MPAPSVTPSSNTSALLSPLGFSDPMPRSSTLQPRHKLRPFTNSKSFILLLPAELSKPNVLGLVGHDPAQKVLSPSNRVPVTVGGGVGWGRQVRRRVGYWGMGNLYREGVFKGGYHSEPCPKQAMSSSQC